MKHQFKTLFGFAAAAAMLLSGCTKDPVTEGDGGNGSLQSDDYVYVTAGIALPSSGGSRSGTDTPAGDGNNNTNSDGSNKNENPDPDYEYGYDYENEVRTMILVVATDAVKLKDSKTAQADQYITHTVVTNITETPAASPSKNFDFKVIGEIQYSSLQKAYDKTNGVLGKLVEQLDDNEKLTVRVYAFCNYTNNLLDVFNGCTQGETTWIDEVETVTEAGSPAGHTPAITNTIWAPRSFLMTSASVKTYEFPKEIDGWDNYSDKNSPYLLCSDGVSQTESSTLTAINVERAAARLDFRDGSKSKDQTYELSSYQAKAGDDKQLNLFNVKLTRMALVNMNKKFYYLRRVSKDGTATDWEVGGIETVSGGKTPYVVDVNWANKQYLNPDSENKNITASNAATYFNFPLFVKDKDEYNKYPYNRENWYADAISTVLDSKQYDDTWEGSASNRYKIWRYVTENTIPKGTDDLAQRVDYTTGIVFKAAIKAGEDVAEKYEETTTGKDDDGHPIKVSKDFVSKKVQDALATAAKEDKEEREGLTEDNADQNTSSKYYDYPPLYSYSTDNMLYAGMEDLIQGAIENGYNGPLYMAVEKMLEKWYLEYDPNAETITGEFAYAAEKPTAADGKKIQSLSVEIWNDIIKKLDETDFTKCTVKYADAKTQAGKEEQFMLEAADNGITVYRASDENDGEGWGYYCYYFYWNRHNDNLKSGKMGPMEFATVRNNVYKLAVTGISKLGHPRVPEYDPDPVEPGDPDEDPMAYIKVQVEVLPWVVRENNIQF